MLLVIEEIKTFVASIAKGATEVKGATKELNVVADKLNGALNKFKT